MARVLSSGGAAAIAVVMTGVLAAGGKVPSDILVKTTVYDTAGATPLRVQSDGGTGAVGETAAVYETTTVGAKTTVTSTIYSFSGTIGQDFFLTTYCTSRGSYAASGRTVRIDTSDQRSSGSFDTPDLGSGLVPVQIGVKCRLALPGAVNLVGMTLDQSVACPGSLRFWAPDGQWYRFSFQPENFSNSDRWQVTCTAAGTSGCTKWTITPSGTDGTSVNTLLRIDPAGSILAVGGDYGLTYPLLVER